MIHWKKFLEFEVKNDLFDLKQDDLHIWDILRFHVYVTYMWTNFQQQKHAPLEVLFRQLRRLRSLVSFVFSKPRPNLFFLHSRDTMPDGRFYDRNAHDFLLRMAGQSHILETGEGSNKHYHYTVSLFNCANLFKRLYYPFCRRRDYSALARKINNQLGLSWTSRDINRQIAWFKGERIFYRWLLRTAGTRRVYVTFDIPKALYCAAREEGVEAIEFQHGIIDKGHIAYNYPRTIRDRSRVYCPDRLLTFSRFWCKDVHYPVDRIIPVGNTQLADIELTGRHADPKSRVLCFISADVFGILMAGLAIEYTLLHPADRILFKLHPHQFGHRKEYERRFQDYPAIRVVTHENPAQKMVLNCDAIVLIQSTIAYEALQAGVPVFIYKRMTFYRHSHIFSHPGVKLIDNAEQIVSADDTSDASCLSHPPGGDKFFEDFDERVYLLLANTK